MFVSTCSLVAAVCNSSFNGEWSGPSCNESFQQRTHRFDPSKKIYMECAFRCLFDKDFERVDSYNNSNKKPATLQDFVYSEIRQELRSKFGSLVGSGVGTGPDMRSLFRRTKYSRIFMECEATYETPEQLATLEQAIQDLPDIIQSRIAEKYPVEAKHFSWVQPPHSPPKGLVEFWYRVRILNGSSSGSDKKTDPSMDDGKPKQDMSAALHLCANAVYNHIAFLFFKDMGHEYYYNENAPPTDVRLTMIGRRNSRGSKRLTKFLAKRAIRRVASRHGWFDVEFDD